MRSNKVKLGYKVYTALHSESCRLQVIPSIAILSDVPFWVYFLSGSTAPL